MVSLKLLPLVHQQRHSIVFVSDELPEATEAMVVDVEDNAILKHGEQFADYLKKGLSDNWSQVRWVGWYVTVSNLHKSSSRSCIILFQNLS